MIRITHHNPHLYTVNDKLVKKNEQGQWVEHDQSLTDVEWKEFRAAMRAQEMNLNNRKN